MNRYTPNVYGYRYVFLSDYVRYPLWEATFPFVPVLQLYPLHVVVYIAMIFDFFYLPDEAKSSLFGSFVRSDTFHPQWSVGEVWRLRWIYKTLSAFCNNDRITWSQNHEREINSECLSERVVRSSSQCLLNPEYLQICVAETQLWLWRSLHFKVILSNWDLS